MSFEHVLYEMTFANIKMYTSTIPVTGKTEDRDDEIIDGDSIDSQLILDKIEESNYE